MLTFIQSSQNLQFKKLTVLCRLDGQTDRSSYRSVSHFKNLNNTERRIILGSRNNKFTLFKWEANKYDWEMGNVLNPFLVDILDLCETVRDGNVIFCRMSIIFVHILENLSNISQNCLNLIIQSWSLIKGTVHKFLILVYRKIC